MNKFLNTQAPHLGSDESTSFGNPLGREALGMKVRQV